MTKRKLLLGLIVVAGVGAALVYWFVAARPVYPGSTLNVSGNIEVIDAEVSFKIPGRVVERLFDEGEPVAKGKVVATIDAADLKAERDARQAELDMARAALRELEQGSLLEEKRAAEAAMKKAAAALEELEHGSRPQQIKAAQAAFDAASIERDRLKTELGRAEKLRVEQTISQEDFDRAKAAYDVAVAKAHEAAEQLDLVKEGPRREAIQQAEEALRQATAQHKLVDDGPREELKEQARAKVRQAEAAVRLAETRLGYAEVTSPLTGIVLSKNVEPGEYVAAGTPVVTVGDLRNVWLRAYVDEPYLGLVKVGQKALVRPDGPTAREFEGRVSFIAAEAEFTPKNVQTAKERSKLVFRIKIDVDNPGMELKRGMPADAEILLDSAPSQPAGPAKEAGKGKEAQTTGRLGR
jgi:HlyD family secretion protein